MKKKILLEMPWASGLKCPYCGFKFGFDARLELWTPDPLKNSENYKEFSKIHKLPITCLKCGMDLVYNFDTHQIWKFDKVINRIKPSLREYLKKVLPYMKTVLRLGDSVIMENHLTFETFVKGQTDSED